MRLHKIIFFFALIASLIGFTSCADDNNDDKPQEQTNAPDNDGEREERPRGDEDGDDGENEDNEGEEEPNNDGIYFSLIRELNGDVSGTPFGIADIVIRDGEVTVELEATGTQPNTLHAQHIHLGSECPTMEDDANGDGFVDVVEGLPKYGPILIPLDDDLSSQAAGATGFPTSDDNGRYVYSKSASLEATLKDLKSEDSNPDDALAKLGDESLNLNDRHIVIHGVPEDTELPGSVKTIMGLPAHVTLPIACGAIQKIDLGNE